MEAILKFRFWILLGLALPMALYGYYSTSGPLKAATADREKALDSVKSGIPAGQADPNKKYEQKLKGINDLLSGYVDDAVVDIWKVQQASMVWPPRVADKIPKKFGELISDSSVVFAYKRDYTDNLMTAAFGEFEPVVHDPTVKVTWPQKVLLDIKSLPLKQFSRLDGSPAIWEAQEDLWLLSQIAGAVRHMNRDADNVNEAVIRRIDMVRLLGGTGKPELVSSAGGTQAMYGGDSSGTATGMPTDGFGGGFGGGLGGQQGRKQAQVSFNPAEEIGSEQLGAAAGGQMYTESSSSTGAPSGGLPGITAQNTPPKRYIMEGETVAEGAKFVERGFYVSVIINQMRIPDFIVALNNMPWPTKIKRFQFGPNPYAPADGAVTRGSDSNSFGAGFPSPDYQSEGASQFSPPEYPSASTESPGFPMGGAFGQPMGPIRGKVEDRTGALVHPDLVQLDVLGVISIYREPTEVITKVEAAAAAASSTPADAAGTPADPAVAPAADPSETAPQSTDPAAPPVPADAGANPSDPATSPAPAQDATAAPAEGAPASEAAGEAAAGEAPSGAVPADPAGEAPAPEPAEAAPTN